MSGISGGGEQSAAASPGWIAPAVGAVVRAIKWPVYRLIGSPYIRDDDAKRARRADTFFAALLVADIVAIAAIHHGRPTTSDGSLSGLGWVGVAFLVWRIVDIVATALRITVFANPSQPSRIDTLQPARAVIYALMYFFESALCFGAIYGAFPSLIGGMVAKDGASMFDAMHLSFVTAFTIGYGDVYPKDALRIVTWAQGACSLTLLVVHAGRYVGSLQSSSGPRS